MKNSICLYTTLYPGAEKFFNDFIKSVNFQTYKKFKLILCLNNFSLSKDLANKIKVPFTTITCNLPMNVARVYSLKKISKKFKYIILLDCDDFMDLTRVGLVRKELTKNDFVVNNLHTFSNLKFLKKKWIKFKNNKKIITKDIKDKNFIGLSNLAFRSSIFSKIEKNINTDLIPLDWCIATLFTINNFKGIFKSNIKTFYRQHSSNVSNLNLFSKKQVLKDLNIKLQHCIFFKKFGIFSKKDIIFLKKRISFYKLKNNNYFEKKFKKLKKKYWWSKI